MKLLIHKWAMKSDMGWNYVSLGYRRKNPLRSFQGQTVKDHKKDVFLLSYRIPELISRLHQFFRKVRQNTRVIE